MIWTSWRQQRSLVVAFVVATLAFLALMLFTGLHEQSLWNHFLARPCKGGSINPGQFTNLCGKLASNLSNAQSVNPFVQAVGIALGPLFAAILGVSAVAREIERRTTRLAWTQSGSRSQWLASKCLVNVALLVVILLPTCLMMSWWNHAAHYGPRITPKSFPIAGFTSLFLAIFAFELVVALGLFVRRAGWTIAAGLVLVGVVFFAVEFGVQPHLMTPSFMTVSTVQTSQGSTSGFYSSGGAPANSWPRDNAFVPNGTKKTPSVAALNLYANKFNRCMTPARSESNTGYSYCLDHLSLTHVQLYIPDSDFWTLQLLEGSLYLAAALLLTGVSFVRVRRMLA
jgi:hypothetical protein